MKKTLLLMLTLMMTGGVKVWGDTREATYGTPASSGQWTADETTGGGTYAWTGSTNNLMDWFTFSKGELANYTSLHFTTSSYTKVYRVCFMKGSDAAGTILFYSAGDKDIHFATNEQTKNLDLSEITSIKFGGYDEKDASYEGDLSITLASKPFMVKPAVVSFGDDGSATIDPSEIYVLNGTGTLTSDGHGTLTSTATAGSQFCIDLAKEDFSKVTNIKTLASSGDIVSDMVVKNANNNNVGDWYTSKFDANLTDSHRASASEVIRMIWNCNKEGAMTISSVKVTGGVTTAASPKALPLTAAMYHKWSGAGSDATVKEETPASTGSNIGTSSENIYGDLSGNVYASNYADLTPYKTLTLTFTAGTPRLLLNRVSDNGECLEINTATSPYVTLVSEGVWKIDLALITSEKGYAHLNTIKGASHSNATITQAVLALDSQTDYIISGNGPLTASATAALADASATLIDATGLTGTGLTLAPANPNCIFLAKAGALANTENVMVDGTIARLVLTDGHPVAVPEGASATEAAYTRTMPNAFGTICLPYAIEPTGDVRFYTTDGISPDGALQLKALGEVPAGTPAIVWNGAQETQPAITAVGSGPLAAPREGTQDVKLVGTFETQTVDAAQDGENDYYYISGGKFWHATGTLTTNPFRACMTAGKSTAAPARLSLLPDDGEATAIQSLTGGEAPVEAIYDAAGVRRQSLQKGLNIVRMQGGKSVKVIVK